MEFILALVMAVFLGGAAGYLGTLMLSQRMVLVAGPLGHLTLPGIALALIFDFDVSLGAFAFVSAGIVVIWLFEVRTRLPMESLTAIVFATGVAITFLFLPENKTIPALIGDVSRIGPGATAVTVALSLVVFVATRTIYARMILVGISEDLARVEGVNIRVYNFIYLASIALIVALGVRVVGGLMTAALVAIPAATSRHMSTNLTHYAYGGAILGSVACVAGVVTGQLTALPTGPLIVIAGSVLFLISLLFRR